MVIRQIACQARSLFRYRIEFITILFGVHVCETNYTISLDVIITNVNVASLGLNLIFVFDNLTGWQHFSSDCQESGRC